MHAPHVRPAHRARPELHALHTPPPIPPSHAVPRHAVPLHAGPYGYQAMGAWDMLYSPTAKAVLAADLLRPGQLLACCPGFLALTRKTTLVTSMVAMYGAERAWETVPRCACACMMQHSVHAARTSQLLPSLASRPRPRPRPALRGVPALTTARRMLHACAGPACAYPLHAPGIGLRGADAPLLRAQLVQAAGRLGCVGGMGA